MRSHEFTSAIIHISDIECGERNRACDESNPDAFFEAVELLIQDLRTELFVRRGFAPEDIGLVITGDLSHQGHPAELRKTSEMIRQIQDKLGISKDRTAIVPGNHDVNRVVCKKIFDGYSPRLNSKEKIDRGKVCREPEKLSDFNREIMQKNSTMEFSEPGSFLTFDSFAALGVALIGFDTTYACTFHEKDNHGILLKSQVKKAGQALEALLAKEPRLVPIAAMHHCPMALAQRDAKDESFMINGEEALEWLGAEGFSVCLCGHEHKSMSLTDEINGVKVLTTGSYGLSDYYLKQRYGKEQSNKYQILLISPERKSQILFRKLSPIGSPDGIWGPDTDAGGAEGMLKELKFLRPRLNNTTILADDVRTQASIKKSNPIPCGQDRWVVALCIEAPRDILNSVNGVTFYVDGAQRWAENRGTHFLTDVIVRTPDYGLITAELETDSDTFVLTCAPS